MPHLTGRCSGCGKKIHWSKNAKIGDTWKCFRCGTVMRIVPPGQGDPLNTESSRPPSQTTGSPAMPPTRQSPQPTRSSSSGGGSGCLVLLLIVGAASTVGLIRALI